MKLPVAARQLLEQRVTDHPDVSKLAIVSAADRMSKTVLIATAKALGIDIRALVEEARQTQPGMEAILEEKRLGRLRHSEAFPAFRGTLEFPLRMTVLGVETERRARIVWESTPDWPYYDLIKGRVMRGWPGMSFQMEVLALPDGTGWDPEINGEAVSPEGPYWTTLDLFNDGILPEAFYNRFYDAIDDDCLRQDQERRRTAVTARTAEAAACA